MVEKPDHNCSALAYRALGGADCNLAGSYQDGVGLGILSQIASYCPRLRYHTLYFLLAAMPYFDFGRQSFSLVLEFRPVMMYNIDNYLRLMSSMYWAAYFVVSSVVLSTKRTGAARG